MLRFIKFWIGLAMLPLAWAASLALVSLADALRATPGRGVPEELLWTAGGFTLWLFLFATMPRPTRTYVLGHELTHAFWAILLGGSATDLRVTARGGSVKVSKTNWVITLAPYFFPFYTALAIAFFGLLSLWLDLSAYTLLWLGIVGLTWSFHLTFTIAMLVHHQPDIAEHGRVFSYTVIVTINLLGLAFGIAAVSPPTAEFVATTFATEAAAAYTDAWAGLVATVARVRALF